MKWTRRRILVVVAVALVVAAGVVAFGLGHGYGPRPVWSGEPAVALPSPGPSCQPGESEWGLGMGMFRVGVDDHPQSVTAVWWPTMNDEDCRVVETRGGGAVAETLATAVRSAPAPFRGAVQCPSDVGGAVDLYFGYRKGWERVRVRPTGCAYVLAEGRLPRRWLGNDALAALAPAGEWSRILRHTR